MTAAARTGARRLRIDCAGCRHVYSAGPAYTVGGVVRCPMCMHEQPAPPELVDPEGPVVPLSIAELDLRPSPRDAPAIIIAALGIGGAVAAFMSGGADGLILAGYSLFSTLPVSFGLTIARRQLKRRQLPGQSVGGGGSPMALPAAQHDFDAEARPRRPR